MTSYTFGYSPTIFQQAQEAREKRRTILAAVRKRRHIIYEQYRNRLKTRMLKQQMGEHAEVS